MFKITLNDIRLTANSSFCSNAKLLVNSAVYQCDDTKVGFGSLFNVDADELISRAYVSLSKASSTENPSMAWLTIEPAGNLVQSL